MVVQLGSMAIKGVFKAGSMLSGLGKTSGKLKEVKQRGKSTTTEMKRMTGQTHLLSKAMAAIGVAGFSALLMTTPQLAGSLAKIKHEMTMLAWSIGKHLKPALDAVATILRGIRTGDWETVKKGVEELAKAVWDLAAAAGTYVLELVFGKKPVEEAKADLLRWWEKIKKAFYDGDGGKFVVTLVFEPIKWAVDRLNAYWEKVRAEAEAHRVRGSEGPARSLGSVAEEYIARVTGFGANTLGEGQTGLNVPRTGMYKLHAGETVTMRGSTPGEAAGGSTNITLDFSGANINLASGIELDQFAETISNKIAERQHSMTY